MNVLTCGLDSICERPLLHNYYVHQPSKRYITVPETAKLKQKQGMVSQLGAFNALGHFMSLHRGVEMQSQSALAAIQHSMPRSCKCNACYAGVSTNQFQQLARWDFVEISGIAIETLLFGLGGYLAYIVQMPLSSKFTILMLFFTRALYVLSEPVSTFLY
jgi:hypothetical protein